MTRVLARRAGSCELAVLNQLQQLNSARCRLPGALNREQQASHSLRTNATRGPRGAWRGSSGRARTEDY